MTAFIFNRAIGPVGIDCVITEQHESSLEVTKIPIEFGADVTDHAYVQPKRIQLEIATGNAASAYNALVRFQETRIPFVLVSGLYVYTDMLIKKLDAERDASFSTVLKCSATVEQIIIVGSAMALISNLIPSASFGLAGQAGGANSRRAAAPKASISKPEVADRVTETVLRTVASVAVEITGTAKSALQGLTS